MLILTSNGYRHRAWGEHNNSRKRTQTFGTTDPLCLVEVIDLISNMLKSTKGFPR